MCAARELCRPLALASLAHARHKLVVLELSQLVHEPCIFIPKVAHQQHKIWCERSECGVVVRIPLIVAIANNGDAQCERRLVWWLDDPVEHQQRCRRDQRRGRLRGEELRPVQQHCWLASSALLGRRHHCRYKKECRKPCHQVPGTPGRGYKSI